MQLHSLFNLLNTGLTLERCSYPHSIQPGELISLASGYAIEYYTINGKRVPVWFWGEGEIIIPTGPFSAVETIADVTTEKLHHRVVRQALRQFPDAREIYRVMREKMHAAIKERVHDITHLTPAEQYIKLLETKPWVFEQAEEEDIVAYLGMTWEQFRGLRQRN
jgi:hypothetical protein